MSMRIQKNAWWSALVLSGSGTLALIAVVLSGEIPPPIWWIWPPALIVSSIALIRCYRREPSNLRGYWHLRIEDLLTAAFYAAALLAVLKQAIPDVFLPIGFVFAFLNVLAVIIGFLAAQRSGITNRPWKFAFALGYGTRAIGLLGFGAALAVMLMDELNFAQPMAWIRNVLQGSRYEHEILAQHRLLVLHRLALLCLPIGLAIMTAMRLWIGGAPARREADVAPN